MTRFPRWIFPTHELGIFSASASLDFTLRLSYRRGSREGGAQAWVAQLVEQRIENPRVGGSNPPPGTTPPSVGITPCTAGRRRRRIRRTRLNSGLASICRAYPHHQSGFAVNAALQRDPGVAVAQTPSKGRLWRVRCTIRHIGLPHVMENQHFYLLTPPYWVAKGSRLLPNKAVRLWTSSGAFKGCRDKKRRSRVTGGRYC